MVAPLAMPSLGPKVRRNYHLEVFPEKTTEEWQVRIVAPNGRTVFTSGSEGYNKSRAMRAARTFNKMVAYNWLEIRIMDREDNVVRIIKPKI